MSVNQRKTSKNDLSSTIVLLASQQKTVVDNKLIKYLYADTGYLRLILIIY